MRSAILILAIIALIGEISGCSSTEPLAKCHGTARPVNPQPTSKAALTCDGVVA